FILLGASAGLFGVVIGPWRYALARAGGALIIIFGLTMLGLVRLPYLGDERHLALPRALTVGNPSSSLLIGALFALGWSPCIGPILGSVLLIASTNATALSGALLLALFSAGLGLPFMAAALLLSRADAATRHLGRFAHSLSIVGGVFLIFLGALMLAGQSGLLVEWGVSFSGGFYDRLLNFM